MSTSKKPVIWLMLAVLATGNLSTGCGSQPTAQQCNLPALQQAAENTTAATHGSAASTEQTVPDAALQRALLTWVREVPDIDTKAIDKLEQQACSSGQRLSAQQQSQYHTLLADLRHALIVYERDEISVEQAQQFYQAHPERFRRQGTIRVRITPWEGRRALESKEISIDDTTVRQAQEGNDEIIAAALELQPGEVVTVTDRAGNQTQVECLSAELGEVVPFDEVMQAGAQQLAEQIVEEEIWKRAKRAETSR